MLDWTSEPHLGVALVRSVALSRVAGVAHGFSTRVGPDDAPFDLGPATDLSPVFASRRRLLARAAGLGDRDPGSVQQVHGNRIVDASELDGNSSIQADGIVAIRSASPEAVIAVRTADCVPVLLADRSGGAIAAIHAGWRGTAGRIVARAVGRLAEQGFPPEALIAAVGPAIGGCCYRVGAEVTAAVAEATRRPIEATARLDDGGGGRLDLRHANRLQLEDSGVSAASIHVNSACTRCAPERFFSYRREGDRAGRMLALAGFVR